MTLHINIYAETFARIVYILYAACIVLDDKIRGFKTAAGVDSSPSAIGLHRGLAQNIYKDDGSGGRGGG